MIQTLTWQGLQYGLTAMVALMMIGSTGQSADGQNRAGLELFEKQIRPALIKYCYECHSQDAEEIGGKLLLDSREGLLRGGESGRVVVPTAPRKSLLIQSLEYRDIEMPPDGKLPDNLIRAFRRWIRLGAPDPRGPKGPAAEAVNHNTAKKAIESDLWSLQRVIEPKIPTVKETAWPATDTDRFVLARLEQQSLSPVADAEPLVLLRRLYYDLVGLPPAPEEMQRFSADHSPEAYALLVDRLLDSPQFGERWARHWLDVARYAESNGRSRDVVMPHNWRYRNYVIDALNADLPYSQFITEQLAGDLLAADSAEERMRLDIATGFLAIGSKTMVGGNQLLDMVDEQIDVVGKAFLGLTVSCARCHDHKFDPIPTSDYYALAGIFLSTDTRYGGGFKRPNAKKAPQGKVDTLVVLGSYTAEQMAALAEHEVNLVDLQKQRDAMQKKIRRLQQMNAAQGAKKKTPTANKNKGKAKRANQKGRQAQPAQLRNMRKQLRELDNQITAAHLNAPQGVQFAVGVRDKNRVSDTNIRIRGEGKQQGERVARGFLSCVSYEDEPVVDREQSGRLQLAHWIVHEDNPLTARLAVNRIWLHLFGRGIVETIDNFGTNSIGPTHPELLDYLAGQFVSSNWSTKQMIRQLVLSRTYRLSSQQNEKNYAADPSDTLYWRMSRRRLDAESIRDSILSASGSLDLSRPVASPVARMGEGEVGRKINMRPLQEPFMHRSVYLPILRGIVPEILARFDFPEPSNVQGRRDTTNVPAQSLYMLNSPFVIEQSQQMAARLAEEYDGDEDRIERAYLLCFNRPATASEVKHSLQYVSGAESDNSPGNWALFCQALFASSEFRLVSN